MKQSPPASTMAPAAIAIGIVVVVVTSCFGAETFETGKVDRLFSGWNRADSPGAAVVIVKDGSVEYQQGYGCANLEDQTPITPGTVFDAASVAKQFTGLAIAMLIEQGKLSPSDEIRKYLPEVPEFGKPIRIENLLHHTSGLRDWPETLELRGVDMSSAIALGTILQMVGRQRELDFMPGEERSYSNTGYNLLAAIVPRVTGRSLREWSASNLFQPLSMRHTHICDTPEEKVPNFAQSYRRNGKDKFERAISRLAAPGSSSLFITAEDMGKWLMNLENGRVGGRNAIESMLQPGKLNNGKRVDYGFGFGLSDYHGSKMATHTGAWAGYCSIVMWIPQRRFAVAILSNVSDMQTEKLGREIAELCLGYETPQSEAEWAKKHGKDFQVEPSAWESFPGTYRLGAGWLLTIMKEGKRLMAQATGEMKFEMTPLNSNKFFVKAYGANVEFVRTSSDAPVHVLYKGIHAPRLSIPQTSPMQLKAYVGDYWSEELQVAYRIEFSKGQLGMRQGAGEWIRLMAIDVDRFDAERGGWSLKFVRDADTKVTEVGISGGRVRNIRFVRQKD